MLSKADIKYIKSLQVKKYRKQEQCFIIEGAKSVLELLDSDFEVVKVVGTPAFISEIARPRKAAILEVTASELEGLGQFQTNTTALAVARMKHNTPLKIEKNEFGLVLDGIRDPGNLGTIIRTADWFGIDKIIASTETADVYNPKVITSSMGSFTRVKIFYTELSAYVSGCQQKVFGTFLSGLNVHDVDFGSGGLIVIGNESQGIHPHLEKYITDKITIPRFGKAESLNAAIATGIICDHVRKSAKQKA